MPLGGERGQLGGLTEVHIFRARHVLVATAVLVAVAGSGTPALVSGVGAATPTGWQVEATPAPAGSKGAALAALSCPALASCVAVGSFAKSTGAEVALSERWDGTSWSFVPASEPSGALQAYFSGVACTSASACLAVGQWETSTGAHSALSELWDGTKWAIVGVPSPSGAEGTYLSGIACPSSARCLAVGGEQDADGATLPLAEEWDGTRWAVTPAPALAGATYSELTAVACSSTDACTAVGESQGGGNGTLAFAERWDGTRWAAETTPHIAGGASLDSVACPSAASCLAVGEAGTGPTTLAERWDGKTWAVATSPAPTGNAGAFFSGVTCVSTAACEVVGDYLGVGAAQWAIAYSWDGTAWTRQTTRNPGHRYSDLAALTCPASTSCVAVGDVEAAGGLTSPLAEAYSG